MKLERHSLVSLKKNGKALHYPGEKENTFFHKWTRENYPLIYTRQTTQTDAEILQVGIPYYDKLSDKKYRYTYLIQRDQVNKEEKLPLLSEVFSSLSFDFKPNIRVYGSYCWEYLTKLSYLRASSDLDILIEYDKDSLKGLSLLILEIKEHLKGLKIDGEVRFHGLGDCAILELLDENSTSILFKSSHNVFLLDRIQLYEKYPALILQ